jgi:hypothetical protein
MRWGYSAVVGSLGPEIWVEVVAEMQGKGLMLEAVAEIRDYRAGRAVPKWIVPSGPSKVG